MRRAPSQLARWRPLLTQREYEVLSRAVLGWSNEIIAGDLPDPCARSTVKEHITRILDKLGMPDRKRLIHLANSGS